MGNPKRTATTTTPKPATCSQASPDELKPMVQRMLEEMGALREEVRSLTSQVKELNDLKKMVVELKKEVKDLKADKEEAFARIDDLEQYGRRPSLRIFGIPEKQGEDTDVEVLKVAEKLKVPISIADISRSHRVGKPVDKEHGKDAKPRGIIVRFTSYRTRRLLFSEKRKLAGTGVVIREDLTARRRELLADAVVKYGRENVWTTDGNIVYKKGTKVYFATRKAHLQ